MNSKQNTTSSKLTKPQIRRSMRYATIAAVTGILGMSCIDGPMLTLVALKLGGEEMFVGAVNFLIWGCVVFSVFSMTAMERFGKKKTLMVGHILQYHPAILELKKLTESGELGKIHYIYSNRLNIGKIRSEENILWSFAPHDISVILMLLDEYPSAVSSCT